MKQYIRQLYFCVGLWDVSHTLVTDHG